MRNRLKCFLYVLLLVCVVHISVAQKLPKSALPVFTSDSLRSGTAKDIAVSFFQLAFNNLVGNNKEFNFTSNPYGVMLKSNPKLAMDVNYEKYRALRRLNFSFGVKLDSAYRFNGFSSGVKYALVDGRDATTSRLLFSRLKAEEEFFGERRKLENGLNDFADKYFPNAETEGHPDFGKLLVFNENFNLFFQRDVPLGKLDTLFQRAVTTIIKDSSLGIVQRLMKKDPAASLFTISNKEYENLANTIKKEPLWTIGLSDTTYKDQFVFSNIALVTEFSKGVFKPQPGANNLELNIKAACNFLQDTLQSGRNLKRILFSFEPGINWVIRDKENELSYLECKFSGSYRRNFSGLYAGEERDVISLNGTIRVRIFDDVWIPLEVKWDPKNGNVLGLFNVKANFSGIGKLIKAAAGQ